MNDYKTIAESNSFIVLDKYIKEWQVSESYQSEYDLEREFIRDLKNQGHEFLHDLPCEIERRQKQCEYYRDLPLGFDRNDHAN